MLVSGDNPVNANRSEIADKGQGRGRKQTIQKIYVQRNIVQLSHNHCCCGKATSVTYSECASVVLLSSMQSACAVLYFYLCPVRLYQTFLRYVINSTIFGKNLLKIECVFGFSLQRLSEALAV
jgi:hypothetical protein